MSKYTQEHFVLAKRVLRDLQGTREFGLLSKKHACLELQFTAYSDAGLSSDKYDWRSITGFDLQMNGYTYALPTVSIVCASVLRLGQD